ADMIPYVDDPDTLFYGKVRLTDCTGLLTWEVPAVGTRNQTPSRSYLPHHQSIFYPRCYFSKYDYDPEMGYRADAHYTRRAFRLLGSVFTNVTLVHSTLGGISSRPITSVAELRREVQLETAFARYLAAETGSYFSFIDVGTGLFVKYVASRAGGLPLVHRL